MRHTERLAALAELPQVTIVEGDVNNYQRLVEAMQAVDIVYANLGGQFEPMSKKLYRQWLKLEFSA